MTEVIIAIIGAITTEGQIKSGTGTREIKGRRCFSEIMSEMKHQVLVISWKQKIKRAKLRTTSRSVI